MPHFYGQPLEQAPVYLMVIEYGDECNTVDAGYRTFYPVGALAISQTFESLKRHF